MPTKSNQILLQAALSSVELDNMPVSTNGLAEAMGVSRWTIQRWREKGYEYQFGNLTTTGHLKAWLEEHKHELRRKSREDKKKEASVQEDPRMEAGLIQMRQ
jgi:hypothetical protein